MTSGRRSHAWLQAIRSSLAVGGVCALLACSGGTGLEPTVARTSAVGDYIETGDLPEITARGHLRILMPPREVPALPRRGYTLDFEQELAQRLAEELGLEAIVIPVRERGKMLRDLLDGKGDLVVARLTATPKRQEHFDFSIPLEYVREVLVCRASDPVIAEPEDLTGKRVAVRASSSYYGTLLRLQRKIPEILIQTVPEHLDTEELLYRVAQGEYDATVADEDIFHEVLSYQDDLRSPFALTDERPIGWAFRPDSPRLKEAVDQFLHEQALNQDLDDLLLGDLDAIQERRVLRVLTLNSAVSYFLYRGKQMGFDFELVRRFARESGCRIQVVVPPRAGLLIPWLLEGRGDLVAASMTVTEERRREVAFTRPYNHVSEIIVARKDDDSVQEMKDLAGRAIAVRESSSYFETLSALREQAGFEIVEVPENLTTENLIAMVASGEYELTAADSNILDIELTYRDDVRGAFALGEPEEIAWIVRPGDAQLLEAVNDYLSREYRGAFYNVLKKKYFGSKRRLARMVTERPSRQGKISPYDELFKKYGRLIEVDWRLLAAQAYEESRFNPTAESWAGALGLMQVLPRTAEELGIQGDLRDPEVGIRAGALYLRWLLDLYDPSLPPGERLRFALGAYNAGRGHIFDGRRLAREHGLDPDRWFDNVEDVLPMLSKPDVAQRARFGYCRCREPVAYVRQINERYRAYSLAVD